MRGAGLFLPAVDLPHPRCRYTTAIPTEHGILGGLTKALAEKLKKDAIVITTDYRLGQGFSLLESIEGDNPGVGGEKADGRGVKGREEQGWHLEEALAKFPGEPPESRGGLRAPEQ